MKSPKESPEDRAARLRERRISELERTGAATRNSAGLASELNAIYGLRGLRPMPAPVQGSRYK